MPKTKNAPWYQTPEKLFELEIGWFIRRRYHKALKMSEQRLRDWLQPLRGLIPPVMATEEGRRSHLPFQIVMPKGRISLEQGQYLEVDKDSPPVERLGLFHVENAPGVVTPPQPYLITDVSLATLKGSTITEVIKYSDGPLRKLGRTPLTDQEGEAIKTIVFELLDEHTIQLAGSRTCGGVGIACLAAHWETKFPIVGYIAGDEDLEAIREAIRRKHPNMLKKPLFASCASRLALPA